MALLGIKLLKKKKKVSKVSSQNNSETVESEIQIPKERYIPHKKSSKLLTT